jgi:hypothetical protein
MKKTPIILIAILFIWLFSSCADSQKEKELELKQKELELKEKELDQKDKATATPITNAPTVIEKRITETTKPNKPKLNADSMAGLAYYATDTSMSAYISYEELAGYWFILDGGGEGISFYRSKKFSVDEDAGTYSGTYKIQPLTNNITLTYYSGKKIKMIASRNINDGEWRVNSMIKRPE